MTDGGIQRQEYRVDFRTFVSYLEEATQFFKSHYPQGLNFGNAWSTQLFDKARWEQPMDEKIRQGVIRAKVPASEAMTHLVEDIGNDSRVWSVDCLEFTQLIRIYAYWKTLSESEFNERFNPLEIGQTARTKFGWDNYICLESNRPGQRHPRIIRTPSGDLGIREQELRVDPGRVAPEQPEYAVRTWDELLNVAPGGTHIMWTSFDLQRKRIYNNPQGVNLNWENEHTTKLGQDRYAAWDLGVVTANEIKQTMAAAAFGGEISRVPNGYIEANIFVALMKFPKESSHYAFKMLSPVDVWGIYSK